jgi:CubicO group peptidase (beta-lactamase class C family)
MGELGRLDDLLKGFAERGPAGCALSVERRGKRLYEGYVGYADLESRRPIAPDTIYRIYSMSKLVTCVAALKLFERGLYLINDPLSAYLPEFSDPQVYRRKPVGSIYTSPAASPIRVKDLFAMTAGITYPGSETETERRIGEVVAALDKEEAAGAPYDARAFSKAIATVPLAFDPGSHWKYGLCHDLLGAFVEVLSGKRFGDFLEEEIFAPLGMKDTAFRLAPGAQGRLSSRYDRTGEGRLVKNVAEDAHFMPGAVYESGGGGLLSTLGDYGRFAAMLAAGGELGGERILGRKTVELMARNVLGPQQLADFDWPYLAGYGYGLGVRTMIDPAAGGCNGSVGEFGWSGLLGTWVLVDPKEGLSAVYMQQMLPNFEAYHQPRMRAVIYGSLAD